MPRAMRVIGNGLSAKSASGVAAFVCAPGAMTRGAHDATLRLACAVCPVRVTVRLVCRGSGPGLSASVPSPAGVFLT